MRRGETIPGGPGARVPEDSGKEGSAEVRWYTPGERFDPNATPVEVPGGGAKLDIAHTIIDDISALETIHPNKVPIRKERRRTDGMVSHEPEAVARRNAEEVMKTGLASSVLGISRDDLYHLRKITSDWDGTAPSVKNERLLYKLAMYLSKKFDREIGPDLFEAAAYAAIKTSEFLWATNYREKIKKKIEENPGLDGEDEFPFDYFFDLARDYIKHGELSKKLGLEKNTAEDKASRYDQTRIRGIGTDGEGQILRESTFGPDLDRKGTLGDHLREDPDFVVDLDDHLEVTDVNGETWLIDNVSAAQPMAPRRQPSNEHSHHRTVRNIKEAQDMARVAEYGVALRSVEDGDDIALLDTDITVDSGGHLIPLNRSANDIPPQLLSPPTNPGILRQRS